MIFSRWTSPLCILEVGIRSQDWTAAEFSEGLRVEDNDRRTPKLYSAWICTTWAYQEAPDCAAAIGPQGHLGPIGGGWARQLQHPDSCETEYIHHAVTSWPINKHRVIITTVPRLWQETPDTRPDKEPYLDLYAFLCPNLVSWHWPTPLINKLLWYMLFLPLYSQVIRGLIVPMW